MTFQHFDARAVLRSIVLDSQNSQDSRGRDWKAGNACGAEVMKACMPLHGEVPEMFRMAFPDDWREGYVRLCHVPPPLALPESRWRRLIDDSGRMLEEWGCQLSATAWDTMALWGCNPQAPEVRADCKGIALSLNGRRVAAVTETAVCIVGRDGVRLSIYRRPTPPGVVPVWDLK